MKTHRILLACATLSLLTLGAIAQDATAGNKGKNAGPHRPTPEEIIKKFDTDGDAKLDATELGTALAAIHDRKEELVKKFDKDGDGKLSDEERAAAKEAMAGKRGGREKKAVN
jgi:hypothetical protein